MKVLESCSNKRVKNLFLKKKIALTFDDGHKNAEQVLEKLEYYSEKATFFLCGCYIEKNLDIYKKIYSSGHEIGNHSFGHPNMTKISESEALSEIAQTQQLIMKITDGNDVPKLFRFPYGAQNKTVIQLVENEGFIPVKWTIDSMDWTGITAEEIYDNVLKSEHLKNGAIVLMHTSGAHTVEALDLIIPQLRKKGYNIVKISDLFELNPQKNPYDSSDKIEGHQGAAGEWRTGCTGL